MAGPVKPAYGELEEVLRRALAAGADRDALQRLAEDVADDEDLDPRRALDRAERLWEEQPGKREPPDSGVPGSVREPPD